VPFTEGRLPVEPQFFLVLPEDTQRETPTIASLEAKTEYIYTFCEQAVPVNSAEGACVTLFENIKINCMHLLHWCRI